MSDAPKEIWLEPCEVDKLHPLGLAPCWSDWDCSTDNEPAPHYLLDTGTLMETIECPRCEDGYIKDKILGSRKCSTCSGTGRRVKP